MNNDIFEKELAQCAKLSHKNGGACSWGKCKECGAIPLLYKLHKGVLLEDSEEINRTKKKYVEI